MEEKPKIFMIERFRLQKSCWLAKVINTASKGEAIILPMYTISNSLRTLFALESIYFMI